MKHEIYRFSTDWIQRLETEQHWRLYWRQASLLDGLVLPGQHVLEIGKGTGFTANYLESRRIQVTTLDIDPGKDPDIVANVVSYEFDREFDHILAFEVFEHIPFDDFTTVLRRIRAACRQALFFSVPRCERVLIRAAARIAKLGERNFELTVRRRRIRELHHHWEMDHPRTPARLLLHTFGESGWQIIRRDRAFSRYFFALGKRNATTI